MQIINYTYDARNVVQVEDGKLPLSRRKYHSSVPELERQQIQELFLSIENFWKFLARGANTVRVCVRCACACARERD